MARTVDGYASPQRRRWYDVRGSSPSNHDVDAVNQHDRQGARRVYRWLWLSPLLTVPTLLGIILAVAVLVLTTSFETLTDRQAESTLRVIYQLAVLGSAAWHLILLGPVRDGSDFVRWHGRQALALAGVRTAVALLMGISLGTVWACPVPVIMIIVWTAGTSWGQWEAGRGKCSLMRWTGHKDVLLDWQDRAGEEEGPADPEVLVEIIRSGTDPDTRWQALKQLKELGMVEFL